MYPSSVATRRVKPLPKRRRTDSISTSVPSNVNLNHYYHSSASPHFNSNVHTYNSLPFPLPQNLPDPHSLPPLPPNLPSTPPVPSLLPISDELLTQWRDYCLPLLGSAADALLSAGGLGGQVYSGGRSGNPNSTRGSERDQTAGGGAGGGEPNPPNPLFPFSQLTPQVASQLTAQLESFVSLASAAVSAASGGTGGGSQPESSANFANTAASLGGPPSLSSPNQGPGPTPPQLDPVTAATYFTHHLNASLRAAGLSGAFPPTAPQPTVSTTDSLYSNRPKVMGGDKGHTPNGISTQPLPSHHDRVLEADEVGGGVSDRDYREDELDDRDDRDDDRANGRNNTKKRKVPGLFSRSGVMNGDGTERVVNGYGVNGLPLDIRAGEGEGVVDTEGNRIREIEYMGELGRGNRGMMGHESRRPRARPTMSRVTMAGIQHKTRKRQLASVLLRGVNENVPHNNASTVPITSGVQNEGAKVKPHTGATTASVSTELALDQMLSDLTGLGLYSYPSLGLPPGNGTAASLTEKPKVKVRLSKRKGVRNARKVSHGGGKEGKPSGKVNKENDLPPPPASITGKKKKGRGSGARAEPSGDTDEAKDGGSEERGILVPKCNFTFTRRSATSGRLQATKEQVKLLRSRFEAELARQTAKLAGEAKLRANENGADGRVGKKRVTSTTGGGGNTISAGATTANASTATATSNVESASQSSTPSKNVNKKKKKKRSALANASNPHHLRNYVPSRVPGIGNTNNHQANANANVNDANELGPLPQQFLSAEIRPKKRGGKNDSNAFVNSASNLNLANPAEEWICAFCEYELFYGDDADFRKAVRKRKAILRRRKRAKEKAADKASGEASRRVRERQKELEKEQMNQQAQSTQTASTGQSQDSPPNPNDLDGDLESEGYNEDEYDREEEE